jgi:hypothetical protein
MTTDGWNQKKAEVWLKKHNYKIKKKDPHFLGNEIRYNQLPKQKFKSDSYITKILPNKVHMILGERIK